MKKSHTELTYLRAAAQNATSVGLVIILYDLLVQDMEQAIAALTDRDVERRSAEIRHAFLVLQQLEGSLDKDNAPDSAKHFSAFYSALRSKIFEAHLKANPEILRRQIELVLDVRQAWQQVDKPNLGSTPEAGKDSIAREREQRSMAAAAGNAEVVTMSWNA